MQIQPVNAIQFLLFSQSLLLALYLISQAKLKPLAGFMLAMALHMAINLVTETAGHLGMPDLAHGLSFLYGPFIYLFVREMVYANAVSFRDYRWHFLPAVLALPIPWVISNGRQWLGLAVIVSMIYYISQSYRVISHYHQVLKDTQSSDGITLLWLSRLLTLFAAIFVFDLARYIVNFTHYQVAQQVFYVALTTMVFVFVNAIVYKGLKHPEAFSGISREDEKLSNGLQNSDAQSPLTHQQQQELEDRLRELMVSQRPYLKSALTVSELAEQLALSSRDLSLFLNQYLKRSFCDLVNQYRVEAAKNLLKQDKDQSVTQIMYEVGFNSKSSFNQAFRKITGLTPSSYKSQNRTDS
jgi:AraC-like DNA-binding protein